MAQTDPFVKFDVNVDIAPFQAAIARFRRHVAGLGIAVDLAATVTEADVEEYAAQFATPTKGREAADLRWIAEHRGDWERMVADGIAWLVAADEHVAAIEATITTTTED